MPKFLDAPQWYTSSGTLVDMGSPGTGVSGKYFGTNSTGTIGYYNNQFASVNGVVPSSTSIYAPTSPGGSGQFLISNGATSAPRWRSVCLYRHNIVFMSQWNFNTPSNSGDWPMYGGTTFTTLISRSSIEIESVDGFYSAFMQAQGDSLTSCGCFPIFMNGQAGDMGLGQNGFLLISGTFILVTTPNSTTGRSMRVWGVKTLPASTPVGTYVQVYGDVSSVESDTIETLYIQPVG